MPKGEDPNEFRADEIVEHLDQVGSEGKEVLTGDRDVDSEVATGEGGDNEVEEEEKAV